MKERKKECITEGKSRRRRDKKAPWALNYGSGEGEGDEKERRRGGEKRRAKKSGFPKRIFMSLCEFFVCGLSFEFSI